jgi:hypothetical protein
MSNVLFVQGQAISFVIRTISAPAPSGSSGQVDVQDNPLAFVRDITDCLGLRCFPVWQGSASSRR